MSWAAFALSASRSYPNDRLRYLLRRPLGLFLLPRPAHCDRSLRSKTTASYAFTGPTDLKSIPHQLTPVPVGHADTLEGPLSLRVFGCLPVTARGAARRQASEKPRRRKPRGEYAPAAVSVYGDLRRGSARLGGSRTELPA